MQPYGPNTIIKQFIKLTASSVVEISFTEIELTDETDSHLISGDFKLGRLDFYRLMMKQGQLESGEDYISVTRYIRDLDPSHEDWEHDFEFYNHVSTQILANRPLFKNLVINSDGELVTKEQSAA